MEAIFASIDYWHWWILAGVLLIIEVAAPSFFFLWLSVAAGITGLALLAVPELAWEYQILLFSGLAILSLTVFKRYQRAHPVTTDQPALNRRGEQYIGRTFTLTEPILNNTGKIHVDDSTWRVKGSDLPAGAKVRITGVDGVILEVEAAQG